MPTTSSLVAVAAALGTCSCLFTFFPLVPFVLFAELSSSPTAMGMASRCAALEAAAPTTTVPLEDVAGGADAAAEVGAAEARFLPLALFLLFGAPLAFFS